LKELNTVRIRPGKGALDQRHAAAIMSVPKSPTHNGWEIRARAELAGQARKIDDDFECKYLPGRPLWQFLRKSLMISVRPP